MTQPPSILETLVNAAQQHTPANFAQRGTIRQGKSDLLVVGLDNGNDALKGAVLTEEGRLVTLRIPTAIREALVVRGGKQEVTYTIGETTFWIGDTALDHDGDGLFIGPTYQRIVDPRMRLFLAAGLVELLVAAGYAPSVYLLAIGFAIPNDEIVPIRSDSGDEERLGVCDKTRSVLLTYLKGASWQITRTDPDGTVAVWELQIAVVLPQAQTVGTLLAYTHSPTGKVVTDLEGVTVIDIGGGDLQRIECAIQPYQIVARRLGDGTIRIARVLKEKFPQLELSDVAAQRALITKRLMVSGRTRDISVQVQEAIASQGQAILADLLPSLRQSRRFVIITGGGVILLQDRIAERLTLEPKRAGDDYDLIHPELAAMLNAVAVLFAVIFKSAKKR